MSINRQRALLCITLLTLGIVVGCGPAGKGQKNRPAAEVNNLDRTIGSLVEVFASDAILTRGYALVGGLNGTGSSECPPQIRSYLDKYIRQHISGTKVNIDEFISSPDTAVVTVEGIILPAATKNQHFDVRVAALQGTQTTSLAGGWLYGADLYEASQFGMSINPLAKAEGPIYVDLISSEKTDLRSGFVLGGGTVLEDYTINLALRKPDYRVAGQIRNRINERFGYDTAWALTPSAIELRVPAKYNDSKGRFIQVVRATYLTESPELTEKRINILIRNLATGQNRQRSEFALEAIGNTAVPKLSALLNSSEPEVRFRAARCMLNLGDAQGKEAVFGIAADKKSPYRTNAIEAIVSSAAKEDAASMLRGLLNDDDFEVRLTAYENLARFRDASISRKLIAESFYLDQISSSGKQAIFVSRRNEPCVALFGPPIYCRSDLFVQTPDGSITINAPAGQQVVTIIRKHPRRPETLARVNSSLELADIIQTLCNEPQALPKEGGPGLAVPYSTLVLLLKEMVDSGAVSAEFHPGPLPKFAPVRSQ